jgi:acetolactate synthase-1/2/3 large subunit
MVKVSGAKALIESLKLHSVDTIFGIISIHTLDIYDILRQEQKNLKFIGGRQELGVGFMADGYARVTGKPGVLLTSTGPGAADSIGAVGEAYFSASPVLEITTNVEQEFIGKGLLTTHETKDQAAMFSSVTDWNAQINQVEAIPDHFVEAFQRFSSKRPRPIELELPTDLLSQEADVELLPPVTPDIPKGSEAQIEQAGELLLKSKRPVIFLGEEVQMLGGYSEIIHFAEKHNIPVVTGDGAKGTFPENHELSLGQAIGKRIWGENPLLDWLGTCDVGLVLGASLPYRSTRGIGLQMPSKLIHVLMDEEIINKNYDSEVAIVGNSELVLQQIQTYIGDRSIDIVTQYKSEITDLKNQINSTLESTWSNETKTWKAIREVLPQDTIFSLDPTVPASRASRILEINQPKSFMYPHGWLGLGFAFPAALGGKVGQPDKPVVCVTGDGGFQYNLQELATAKQYNLNPIVLMFNDNAWGVLKDYQKQRFDSKFFATDLVNPNFSKLFDSYGFASTVVTNLIELTKALESAAGAKELQLIEVQIPNGFSEFV